MKGEPPERDDGHLLTGHLTHQPDPEQSEIAVAKRCEELQPTKQESAQHGASRGQDLGLGQRNVAQTHGMLVIPGRQGEADQSIPLGNPDPLAG